MCAKANLYKKKFLCILLNGLSVAYISRVILWILKLFTFYLWKLLQRFDI